MKSFTPTQYTIAPRRLASSAYWKTRANASHASSLRKIAGYQTGKGFLTWCCALMSCCVCRSPSVKAIITLAVPGKYTNKCCNFKIRSKLQKYMTTLKMLATHQIFPYVSGHLPLCRQTCSLLEEIWAGIVKNIHLALTVFCITYCVVKWECYNVCLHSSAPGPSVYLHQLSLCSEHSDPFGCSLCRGEKKNQKVQTILKVKQYTFLEIFYQWKKCIFLNSGLLNDYSVLIGFV